MLLPPPEFFCNTCLNLNLDKRGRLEMAKVVNRGEPCVRSWHRNNSFPQGAIDKWTQYLGQIGDGGLAADLDAVMKEPFRAATEAYKWRVFCQGILANQDAFLPFTFGEILSYSGEWLDFVSSARKLDVDLRFDAFKEHILSVVGPRFNIPSDLQQQVQASMDWDDLKPAMTWLLVETFLYFLSMAEGECLWLYHGIKEPKLSNVMLPKLQKGKVQYPIKRFFGYFFDNLVSRGIHQSLDDIAEKMPRVLPLDRKARAKGRSGSRVDKDSGWREIKRAKYQGKAPAFETFRAWIDALIPAQIYSSPEERESEKQLLCDALGAARIVDRFFREASNDVPVKELIARFESYDSWRQLHIAAIIAEPKEGPGIHQAPPSC